MSLHRVWYWAFVERDSKGRFIASVPDFECLTANGTTEKDAVAKVTRLVVEHVWSLVEGGQSVPRASEASDLPSAIRSKELDRVLIPVDIGALP